jgi:adenine-specific DNA-methyltransferase
MKKYTVEDAETKSPDLVAGNLELLKAIFPEAFTEDKVDFDVLKQILGGAVEEREEKYGLNWHGKRRARQLALTPSAGTLRPCPEESVDWDTTQNLMIEGDNLEVLKLLQKSYSGKVRLIYIDPPYNKGKDFVYPDDFRDNIKNYLELTGQTDGDGRKISSNTEASGRFHTDWLNMMYPRMRQARNLMRKDGFLVVSIDDVELPRVRFLMDEVFGEENFVSILVYDRNRKNDAKLFSVGHEYMVVYAADKDYLAELDIRLRAPKEGIDELREEFERLRKEFNDDWSRVEEGVLAYYSTFEDGDPRLPLARFTKVDERGPYRTDGDPSWPGGGGPRYDVPHKGTGRPCKVPGRGWVWPTYERMKEVIDAGDIVFGPDESTIPSVRRNLFEKDAQVMRSVIFSYAQTAAQDFAELFDGKKAFSNPKNYFDLKKIVEYLSDPGDIVLDFFAGSGTTGHGVMLANLNQRWMRRFLLVQLPEPLDPQNKDQKEAAEFCIQNGLPTVLTEITKERLRRAGKKIRKDNPMFAGDLGFRVFKLASSNIRAWEPDRDDLPTTLMDSIDHLKTDRTEQDILFELLLKLGLDLTIPIEHKSIAGKTVHSIGAGTLLVCLAEQITATEVESLALGMIAWHKEMAPAGTSTIVFRDSAFADDVAKTNLTAILQQHGLENVRSL